MGQKGLANLMKLAIILIGVVGAVCFAFVIPTLAKNWSGSYAEFAKVVWFWISFLELISIPYYTVLVLGWKVASGIGSDKSFTYRNSTRIKIASYIVLVTSFYFFVGTLCFLNVYFVLANFNHPGMLLMSFLFLFCSIVLGIGLAMVSHIVMKAAELQEQADLTI